MEIENKEPLDDCLLVRIEMEYLCVLPFHSLICIFVLLDLLKEESVLIV